VPVTVPGRKGDTVVTADEGPRSDTSLEALAKLNPAFQPDGGSVTAGNAPGITDGAAALVIGSEEALNGARPRLRITGYAQGRCRPRMALRGADPRVRRLIERVGGSLDDFDLIEDQRGLCAQVLADGERGSGFDWDRVERQRRGDCPRHPIGASGARVLTTLLYELRRRGGWQGPWQPLCLEAGEPSRWRSRPSSPHTRMRTRSSRTPVWRHSTTGSIPIAATSTLCPRDGFGGSSMGEMSWSSAAGPATFGLMLASVVSASTGVRIPRCPSLAFRPRQARFGEIVTWDPDGDDTKLLPCVRSRLMTGNVAQVFLTDEAGHGPPRNPRGPGFRRAADLRDARPGARGLAETGMRSGPYQRIEFTCRRSSKTGASWPNVDAVRDLRLNSCVRTGVKSSLDRPPCVSRDATTRWGVSGRDQLRWSTRSAMPCPIGSAGVRLSSRRRA
jgi:hypothetical protein